MKSKLAFALCCLATFAIAQIRPAPPGNLTAFTITYLAQLNQPVVEFSVPDAETNELVFTGQTNLQYTSAGQNTDVYVGCTNIMEIEWMTHTNVIYSLWVRTNATDDWTYKKIQIIGDGNLFHLYSVANPTRQFLIKPSP